MMTDFNMYIFVICYIGTKATGVVLAGTPAGIPTTRPHHFYMKRHIQKF